MEGKPSSFLSLLKWTLITRLFFYTVQIIVSVIPDHQHSQTTAFIADNRIQPHPLLINILFGGFDNWDSEYYLLIAQYGYRIKECHAFFPLYPLLMRFIATVLFYSPLGYIIPFHSLLLVSGVLISNIAFIASTGLLYLLTVKIFTNNVLSPSSHVPVSPSSHVPVSPLSNEPVSPSSNEPVSPSSNEPVSLSHESASVSSVNSCSSLKRRELSHLSSSLPDPVSSVPDPVSHVPDPVSSSNDPMTQPMVYELAYLTVIMYTVNPATIFMSSVYTESIFAFFSFSGMLAMAYSHPFIAAVSFAGASATRSNGIVTSGFIIYFHCIELIKETQTYSILRMGMRIIIHTTMMLLQIAIIFLPFTIFQMYSYFQFCNEEPLPTLCTNSTLPIPYSYVQEHYWSLGLLNFYEFKQIPHFLFATPMYILTIRGLYKYFNRTNNNVKKCCRAKKPDFSERKQLHIDSTLLPYMVQLLFLLLVAALYMYIQVVTRFVCSSTPVVFWFAGIEFLQDALNLSKNFTPFQYLQELVISGNNWKLGSPRQYNFKQWIIIYFVAYNVLGFVMHCNFLPWV